MRAVAAQCHARGVDGVDGGYGVALYARYLHKAADGVAGKPEVVLHGDLGGVLNLHGVAAHELGKSASRHGAGAADFALAANFSSRDRGVLFVQDADGASGEQKAFDASYVSAGEEVVVIVQYGWDDTGGAVGGSGDHAPASGVLFVDRERVQVDPVNLLESRADKL